MPAGRAGVHPAPTSRQHHSAEYGSTGWLVRGRRHGSTLERALRARPVESRVLVRRRRHHCGRTRPTWSRRPVRARTTKAGRQPCAVDSGKRGARCQPCVGTEAPRARPAVGHLLGITVRSLVASPRGCPRRTSRRPRRRRRRPARGRGAAAGSRPSTAGCARSAG